MSFSKKIGKFKEWLGIGTTYDIKSSAAVIEILSYLAYETVNEIVDLALLVKADQERTDNISANIPISINPLSEHAQNSLKQLNIPKGALPTPTHSPPTTPTGQTNNSNNINNNNNNNNNNNSRTQVGSTSLRAPIQGGLASSLGTASLASSLSGLSKQPKTKKKKTKNSSSNVGEGNSSKIQPSHIREAVRRYNFNKKPLMLASGFSQSTLQQRTLCL